METPKSESPKTASQAPQVSMFELVGGMIQRRDFVLAIRDMTLKMAEESKNPPLLKRSLVDVAHAVDVLDCVLMRLSMEQQAQALAGQKEKGPASSEEESNAKEAPKPQ